MVKSGKKNLLLNSPERGGIHKKMNLVDTILDGIHAQLDGPFRHLCISLNIRERKLLFYAYD
jgi:hypothetical protein